MFTVSEAIVMSLSLICFQFEMPPRVSPLKDACHHVGLKTDKTWKLEVKFINAVKGRGLFAVRPFCKGDFVVEYRGDLVDEAEAERRRRVYHTSCAAFFFLFKWRGKVWCIDASREDGSFGRLVNDEHRHPNCRMKKVEVEGKPHLCLFALKDIKDGEEISYDYGGDDCPWRVQMELCANVCHPVKGSNPAVMSEKETEEASCPLDTPQQMELCAKVCHPVKGSNPAVMSEKETEEASCPLDTPQQMELCAKVCHPVKGSNPAVMSEKETEEASCPLDTPQQVVYLHFLAFAFSTSRKFGLSQWSSSVVLRTHGAPTTCGSGTTPSFTGLSPFSGRLRVSSVSGEMGAKVTGFSGGDFSSCTLSTNANSTINRLAVVREKLAVLAGRSGAGAGLMLSDDGRC
ncbi:hypothetical protein DNTS_019025 [Danionella cerebrum]|uniref:SET domain-containing protein n=1 Tax=Danionella cerebrum TaxID=2873325 RepID=A0A553Q4W2_9TELE|nr:hypothetical protein DNTS_019025 [Danionella translucida]